MTVGHLPEVWIALGYSDSDAEKLEVAVDDLIANGAATDRETARRALAAMTFAPLADAMYLVRLRMRIRRIMRRWWSFV